MAETIDRLLTDAAQARREKRPADAHHDLLEAVALARAAADQRTLARSLSELGRIERDLRQTEAALTSYEAAAAIYRRLGDDLKLAHTIRHIGDIHQDAGRASQAEPFLLEALALYRANPQTAPLDLANALRPLAMLKHDGGNLGDADPLWEEAKNLYASVNVLPGVAECAARLALIARHNEDPERASQMLAEATTAAEASGDYNSIRHINEVRTRIAG
jgi:tetratricopeptide (TPR) repeat protein